MQFRARLDVDHQDVGLERRLDFLVGLAHARKNDLAADRRRPRRQRISSPTETISKPAPISPNSLRMLRFESAFIAKQIR